jgi:hypothetical protein
MGKVIRFPIERRLASARADASAHPREGSAVIVILPVVRYERHGAAGPTPRPRRKSATTRIAAE